MRCSSLACRSAVSRPRLQGNRLARRLVVLKPATLHSEVNTWRRRKSRGWSRAMIGMPLWFGANVQPNVDAPHRLMDGRERPDRLQAAAAATVTSVTLRFHRGDAVDVQADPLECQEREEQPCLPACDEPADPSAAFRGLGTGEGQYAVAMSGSRSPRFGFAWWRLCVSTHQPELSPTSRFPAPG